MPSTPRDTVENTIPVLAVTDVQASIRFYRDVLAGLLASDREVAA